MLNGGQFGSATAGGAGNGAVQGALANGNYKFFKIDISNLIISFKKNNLNP